MKGVVVTRHDLNEIFKVEAETKVYPDSKAYTKELLEESIIDLDAECPPEPEFNPGKVSVNTVYYTKDGRVILDITGIEAFSRSEVRDIIEEAFAKANPS